VLAEIKLLFRLSMASLSLAFREVVVVVYVVFIVVVVTMVMVVVVTTDSPQHALF